MLVMHSPLKEDCQSVKYDNFVLGRVFLDLCTLLLLALNSKQRVHDVGTHGDILNHHEFQQEFGRSLLL